MGKKGQVQLGIYDNKGRYRLNSLPACAGIRLPVPAGRTMQLPDIRRKKPCCKGKNGEYLSPKNKSNNILF